jgi:hypothetical protein
MSLNKTTDQSADMKQSLIEPPKNHRDSISLPKKEDLQAKAAAETKKKTYTLWDFAKFTLPFLWRGGFVIRVQTVLTFVLLFLSKGLNVTHPLILKYAID